MEKVLLVVNPGARSFSARETGIVAKLLEADFEIEVARTKERGHAIELAARAVKEDLDAVLALGGDGTLNEIVQSLAGTDVAAGVLPSGTGNVMARSLGLPMDAVDAVGYVGRRLKARAVRRIKLGRLNDRYFVFAAGAGLDADVVKASEDNPDAKRAAGEWAFVSAGIRIGLGRYAHRPPRMTMVVDGGPAERIAFAVCCNARPFTYIRNRPVDACPQASLEDDLDVFAMTKVVYRDTAKIIWSMLFSKNHPNWPTGRYFHDVGTIELHADQPIGAQVDGDYLGDFQDIRIEIVPDALSLLA